MEAAALIPAYKPSPALVGLAEEVMRAGFSRLILVDDGSGPDFEPIFAACCEVRGVEFLRHPQNRGKGGALKTGLGHLRDHPNQDLGVVTLDADGQHRVSDALRLAEELQAHPDSMVLGVRSFSRPGVPLRSRLGNWVTRLIFAAMVGRMIRDTQTGLRAFPVAWADEFTRLEPEGYDYELEMLLACNRRPIRQLVIDTVYIDGNKSSHFSPIRDSLKIYLTLVRCRFKSIKKKLFGIQ